MERGYPSTDCTQSQMLREGDERAKALLLLALLDIHQSEQMQENMKEPVWLEPMRKIDEIRRFSNKEMTLTKESMGAQPKSSEYCGPIRKKTYNYKRRHTRLLLRLRASSVAKILDVKNCYDKKRC